MTDNTLPVDPNVICKKFKAIKIRQPIGDIIVASVDFKTIQNITFFDVRRRISEDRDVEKYLGIQRPINELRVKELNKYVNYVDATFPGAIILAIEEEYATFIEENNELQISNTKKGETSPSIPIKYSCRVIDGQHRIRGLETFNGFPEKNFDVIVAFFIGSDVSDQAYIFATVNLEQTKVSKSLAVDLYGLAKARSPYKTCHNIAITLDAIPQSPFYKKIKRLGTADPTRINTKGEEIGLTETITQSTFVDGLLNYISKDPRSDRNALLEGKKIQKPSYEEEQKFVFRSLFIQDKDIEIGKIYEAYFEAVKRRWPDAWHYRGNGNILWKTNGYKSLSSIFGKVYLNVAQPGDIVSPDVFLKEFNKVKFDWDHFNTDNYKPGGLGENKLKRDLLEQMGL